jgi:energy-coupling factor transporter ATP-binding protein EcfA2
MKSPVPYFRNFPEDFQKITLKRVMVLLEKNKNVQLIGLKGSGKSILLRAIRQMPEFKSAYKIFTVDLNLLAGFTMSDFRDLIKHEVGGEIETAFEDGGKVLFLIDSFDHVYKKLPEAVNMLKGIEDKYRDYVSFIFTLEKPVLGRAFLGEAVYMEPLGGADFEWFWKGIGGVNKYKAMIYKASGGFMALIKRLNEIAEAGEDVADAIGNPRSYTHLNYQLQVIKEGLDGELPEGIPIYESFINGGDSFRDLTKLEHKAFEFLQKNEGRITDREELIKAVWGENAGIDVADHALDQLIHRLKNKVKSKAGIETVRGRGYRFTAV